jgi:hypothetical protein
MRRLHLVMGIVALIAFLVTGQVMRHHTPPMTALSDAARLMFRSRHIYILGAALVNLMLGLYMMRRMGGWRYTVQGIGSGLVLIAPVLLVIAFAMEGGTDLRGERVWSHWGLYALFGGCVLHAITAVPSGGSISSCRDGI